MQKWIVPSSIGLVVAFFLFSFMAFLVKPPVITNQPISTTPPVDLFNSERTETKNIRPKRALPPKESTAPPVRTMQVLNPDPAGPADKPVFESIGLTGLTGPLGGGSKVNTSLSPFDNNKRDTNATPIVQIQPQYPVDAARKGLEGWVKLSFTIDKTGSVSQVQVLDSSPARVFDNAAKRALKRWRYKAKFVNGVPMIQDNLQVQLDFTLDQ